MEATLTLEKVTLPTLHQRQGTSPERLPETSACGSEPGAAHVVDGHGLESTAANVSISAAIGVVL